MNLVLLLGSLFGCFSVVVGAYFDHVLKTNLSAEQFQQVLAALHYHQLYAVVITIIGLVVLTQTRAAVVSRLKKVAWLFILGIILFSFSTYVSIFTNRPELLMVVPVGAGFLALGWLMLLWAASAKDTNTSSTSNENKDFYYFKKPSK